MNIPNLLSLLRLCLVPVFALTFFGPSSNAHTWAALIYALAFATDIADGYIARKFNMITKLGRILGYRRVLLQGGTDGPGGSGHVPEGEGCDPR